jgi:hypothetical protein
VKGAYTDPPGLIEDPEGTAVEADREAAASGFVWEEAGKPIVVEIDGDVVGRLLKEVQRGFGMVPRRGVELGGILIGSVEPIPDHPGDWLVKVTDFEGIPCSHSRSMGYQLNIDEQLRFAEVRERWRRVSGRHAYAVGYYRSHTREGLSMTSDDVDLFDRWFPEQNAITLLVKPFATRNSTAGIFFRENGEVRTESSYRELPFGGRQPVRSGETHSPPLPPNQRARSASAQQWSPPKGSEPSLPTFEEQPPEPQQPDPVELGIAGTRRHPETGLRFNTGWVWLPLSFVFLLFGAGLGFFMGVNLRTRGFAGANQDPLTLGLTVGPSGNDIEIHWDRGSLGVQGAARGSLLIGDGASQKIVHLDADQLRTGSVLYQRARDAASDVQFRLEVFARERTMIAETAVFKGKEGRSGPAR